VSQLIDRPITPVIPLYAKPQPPACQWPRDPAAADAQLLRAAVLAAVIKGTQHLDLPSVCHWDVWDSIEHRELRTLVESGPDRGHVSGQLLPLTSPDLIRYAVGQWAAALHGRVVETPRSTFLDVRAYVVASGVLVSTWALLPPDASCPACDGLAVGDVVLRHESHCPLLESPGGAR
jgi:hypothetical protein